MSSGVGTGESAEFFRTKGKTVDEKKEFYQKLRGLVPKNRERELFGKPVGEEPESATISKEGLQKLLRAYGQLLGIGSEKLESIIEGTESNGDAYLAKLKHAYAEMCLERGGYFPRGYQG